jgi:hypothetical protein
MIAVNEFRRSGGVHEIGFFLKRARVAEQTLGDAPYHRIRFAQARGF